MPDSLLSRFDLVFVVLDKTDDEFNRAISEHITRLHQFVPGNIYISMLAGLEEGAPITDAMIQSMSGLAVNQDEDKEDQDTSVYQKYNKLLHIGIQPAQDAKKSRRKSGPPKIELLSLAFL